jgi:hypothetical protein
MLGALLPHPVCMNMETNSNKGGRLIAFFCLYLLPTLLQKLYVFSADMYKVNLKIFLQANLLS